MNHSLQHLFSNSQAILDLFKENLHITAQLWIFTENWIAFLQWIDLRQLSCYQFQRFRTWNQLVWTNHVFNFSYIVQTCSPFYLFHRCLVFLPGGDMAQWLSLVAHPWPSAYPEPGVLTTRFRWCGRPPKWSLPPLTYYYTLHHQNDGLAQDCGNSIVSEMELLQFCTKPSRSCCFSEDYAICGMLAVEIG